MFKKKKCKNCGKKINDSYDFCPYCGIEITNLTKENSFGMLGKNDFEGFENIKMPMGLGTLFNSLLKNLDKQMKNIEGDFINNSDFSNVKKEGISINISTSGNSPPRVRIKEFGNSPRKVKKIVKEIKGKQINLPPQIIQQKMKLPKKEPMTKIKRLSSGIVYEMEIPGVKSMDNIAITRLENSIEIKALGDKFVYSKILPVNFPISNYFLENENLTIELIS